VEATTAGLVAATAGLAAGTVRAASLVARPTAGLEAEAVARARSGFLYADRRLEQFADGDIGQQATGPIFLL
jgi:hypothetical protein